MFELILLSPVASVDELSDALEALDALSVSVEDAEILPKVIIIKNKLETYKEKYKKD